MIRAVTCVWIQCAGKFGKLDNGRGFPEIQNLELVDKCLDGIIDSTEVDNQVFVNIRWQKFKFTSASVRAI